MQGAEDELKDAVALIRPVSVAFEAVDGFRFYKEGVYTSTVCGSQPTVGNQICFIWIICCTQIYNLAIASRDIRRNKPSVLDYENGSLLIRLT